MKAYRSAPRGRPTAATLPTARTVAESSTFGCSKSAEEILFRSRRDRGTTGSRIGRPMANTLRIVLRKGKVGYTQSQLWEAQDSNARSRHLVTIPTGHRIT